MDTKLSPSTRPVVVWSAWVVGALLLLPVLSGFGYGLVVASSALALAMVPGTWYRTKMSVTAHDDLIAIAVLYLGVVALMRLAFVGFTTDHVPGLFLSFAAALLLGVVGPVMYVVWRLDGSLSELGIRSDNWRPAVTLGLLFAAVQFALTLWGYSLPAPVDWVPLLVMALVVGVFESVFFRGFIQNRLEARFGSAPAVAGAALLYGLYHIGYGMGAAEIAFLTGLGVVYAVAFSLTHNVLVLWPLLTPLGSFFATMEAGDVSLPWGAVAGFADVLAIMLATLWLARRHARRRQQDGKKGRTVAGTEPSRLPDPGRGHG